MRRYLILFSFFLMVFIIFPYCAPYKMKAIRAQRDHRYDLSIKFALKHLNSHPNDQAAIALLNNAAIGYFDELQKQIQHFENLDSWDKVVRIADQGYRTLSEVTRVVGASFPTKEELNYLQSKSEQSKFKQANELYAEALKLYQNGDYLEAREMFEKIDSYVRHFKDIDRLMADANQKLASAAYQKARNLLSLGQLEDALESFERTTQYVPDFLDVQLQIRQAKEKMAEKYYDEGKALFDNGDYKNAHGALQKSLRYNADNQMAKNLFDEAKDKLTVRLAVFPFSASKLDQKFGNIVSQQILDGAMPRKSEFIMFLERENLQKIFEEQALSQTGVIDEKTAVQVGKMSGVNTILLGSVTLISHKKTGPTKKILTGQYDKKYRDTKGIQRTRREPFNYTAYEVNRSVEVNLNYRLINVEAGSIIFNESLSERVSDTAEWISCPKEFINNLSGSERSKLKTSKEPKSKDSLINQAIASLSKQAASKIINQVSPF